MASTSSSLLSVENIPQDVMRRLSRDIVELVNEPLEGICVIVNDADMTDIQAIIDGPDDTPYAGGKFRVKLVLPKDFPASPPRGFFLTRVFHPNVAQPSGEICVNTLKRDWNASLGIRHILLTVKCLLITPNPESALNEDAGKLLLEDYAAYANRARMITEIHARPSTHPPATNDCALAPKRRAVDDEQSAPAGVTKKASVSKAAATKKLLRRL